MNHHGNACFLEHLETHQERPVLRCPHPGCDVAVRTEKGLRGHLDGVHGDGKKFKCSFCDKRCRSQRFLFKCRVSFGTRFEYRSCRVFFVSDTRTSIP